MYEDDVFFIDSYSAKWVYYNPDSNAGGQFVEIRMPYDEIVELACNHDDFVSFFDYWLDNPAPQYLIDICDGEFGTYAAAYEEAEIRGCSTETMNRLIEIAKEKIKGVLAKYEI